MKTATVAAAEVPLGLTYLSQREWARIDEVVSMLPEGQSTLLDVGARDGRVTHRAAAKFSKTVAIDIAPITWSWPGVETMYGDVTNLQFKDRAFDTVLCSEVLEHIRPELLQQACYELARVAHRDIVIGVPYAQEIRHYCHCQSCGKRSPAWGHWNSFDELKLVRLFRGWRVEQLQLVDEKRDQTTWLADKLMEMAGDPWGPYDDPDESCVYCGVRLKRPTSRTVAQRIAGAAGLVVDKITLALSEPHANWMHARLRRISQ